MDISYKTSDGKFNYRVGAIITHNNKLLIMRTEGFPYYYIPGGRVSLHETAENAIIRELNEELHVSAKIIRPLWLNQNFFIEQVSQDKYHELCLLFLVELVECEHIKNTNKFEIYENGKTNYFEWVVFDKLEPYSLFPSFIKEAIFNLPTDLTIRYEKEYD